MTDFWTRCDAIAAAANTSPAGEVMTAAEFRPWHTGGGSVCWPKNDGRIYYLIVDRRTASA
jgi:hypothetical protein